jgi:hypothetical protein
MHPFPGMYRPSVSTITANPSMFASGPEFLPRKAAQPPVLEVNYPAESNPLNSPFPVTYLPLESLLIKARDGNPVFYEPRTDNYELFRFLYSSFWPLRLPLSIPTCRARPAVAHPCPALSFRRRMESSFRLKACRWGVSSFTGMRTDVDNCRFRQK